MYASCVGELWWVQNVRKSNNCWSTVLPVSVLSLCVFSGYRITSVTLDSSTHGVYLWSNPNLEAWTSLRVMTPPKSCSASTTTTVSFRLQWAERQQQKFQLTPNGTEESMAWYAIVFLEVQFGCFFVFFWLGGWVIWFWALFPSLLLYPFVLLNASAKCFDPESRSAYWLGVPRGCRLGCGVTMMFVGVSWNIISILSAALTGTTSSVAGLSSFV